MSSGGKKMIERGTAIVNEAVEADNKGDYSHALELYRRALDYFKTGLKYEENESVKRIIYERALGYMKRAEDLKKALDVENGVKDDSDDDNENEASTATKKKPKKKKKDKKDDENDKLKGALSSAIVTEKPNIHWSDVAGLEGAKSALKEAVVLPVKFPELFQGNRKPWKGILLYGPPGTGKSFLAKAVATEADSTFFSVSSSDLVSKWQGESERLVKNLFQMARDQERAIIFIDEVDSLCGSRSEGENDSTRRIKTEFLVQMQGVGHDSDGVLVLAATNVPWELDPAMRRRFEKRIYIPLPDITARKRLFELAVGGTDCVLTDEELHNLAERTEGFSGSDISILVRDAVMEPLRKCQTAKQFIQVQDRYQPCLEYPNCRFCPLKLSDDPPNKIYNCNYCNSIRMDLYSVPDGKLLVPPVMFSDFDKSILKTHSSVALNEVGQFVDWTNEFGQEGV